MRLTGLVQGSAVKIIMRWFSHMGEMALTPRLERLTLLYLVNRPLAKIARQIGFSGIGLSQKGNHASRFVHLNTLPRKALFRC